MQYRELGRTGWHISTVSFGAWGIGGDVWGQTDDRESMVRLADEAMAVAGPRGYDNDLRWCLWCLAHGALAAGELGAARTFGERAHGLLTGQRHFPWLSSSSVHPRPL